MTKRASRNARGRGSKSSARRRGKQGEQRSPQRVRAALRAGAVRLALAAAVGIAAWVGWSDLRVRSAFEGKRWVVPAQLYARPLELWPGRVLARDQLEQELAAAGYHRATALTRPASYRREGDRFDIVTRSFTFPDGHEPSRRLAVRLRAGRVEALSAGGEATALARLDPAPIGRVYPTHREDRLPVRLGDVPSELIAALIAVEDRAFPRHLGVSPRAVARAAFANLRAGARVQGGSTLTQQLAKNFLLTPERSWRRKLDEALIAVLIELHYPKEAILQAYLNEVFLGQQGNRAIHGFGLAARHYFARRVDELSLEEVALLVGIVKGPSYYHPRRHPERARARRDLVLDIMAREGLANADAVAAAKRRPLGVVPAPPAGESPHPAFVDLVRRQLARDYHDEDLRSEGLRIFTTLDPIVQRKAERALAERVRALEEAGRANGPVEGAVVVTDPATGRVQGLVGGRRARAVGFNRALDAHRPIGSLVKPAVYLSALARPSEYTLVSPLLDAPVRAAGARGEPWVPKNYDGRAHGEVPLYEALSRSYNLATVRLGLDVGVEEVAATLGRLGVQRSVEPFPSLLLGSLDLSPIDVAAMYQTLATGGFRMPLRAIEAVTDGAGRPLARYRVEARRAVAAEPVFLTVEAMRMVMSEGTGRAAYRWLDERLTAAGKTGTTDGLRDSWFAGFTGNRLAVVWLGRDDNRPTGLTGATGALTVWASLLAGLPAAPLADETPAAVRWYWTRAASGVATDAECPGAIPLPFIEGSAPGYAPCAAVANAAGSPG